MKQQRPWLRWVIALNLAALVALAFVYPHLMVAPGALLPAHAELATDCFACHAPWRGASAARCESCHHLADIGLRSSKGQPLPVRAEKQTGRTSFHQQLIDQDCMACHGDHQGTAAGQRSRKPFSHALLRTEASADCKACHRMPGDALHRKIEAGNCKQCHSQERWKPASFEHAKLFVLDRDHDSACVTCHLGHDYSRYSCYGCHEHSEAKVRAEHEEEGIRDFENCVECHRDPGVEPDERGAGRRGRKRD